MKQPARRKRTLPVAFRLFTSVDWERVRVFLAREEQPSEHAADVLSTVKVKAWLASDGNEVIGWILTRPMRTEDGAPRGGIEDIVVARSYQGRGIGRRLIDLAEGYYRGRGFAGMQLTVRANNNRAIRLYESLGYATVQRRLRMWKDFS